MCFRVRVAHPRLLERQHPGGFQAIANVKKCSIVRLGADPIETVTVVDRFHSAEWPKATQRVSLFRPTGLGGLMHR